MENRWRAPKENLSNVWLFFGAVFLTVIVLGIGLKLGGDVDKVRAGEQHQAK